MSLGNIIKSARESARLSLDDLAAMTSIRVGLLSQMEADDFSGCGGDTYARGHLRTIAAKLHLDAQELLNLYTQEYGAQERRIQDLLVESSVTTPAQEKSAISFKTLALISLAIIIIAALIEIVISNANSRQSAPTPATSISASPTSTQSSEASQSPAPSPSSSEQATNTLKITATRGNAAIDIVTKDGHVYKGWLLQGESKEVTAQSRISIYVSNAGDVDVIFNGEPVPSLGAQGEEIRRTFS